jgi:glucose-1-phosphate cytidylyltransferase
VILCGGRGTRLRERTAEIPKPLVEVGGMPILWHVVNLFAAQGFKRFLLATGYKGHLIERFVQTCGWPPGVSVRCHHTGARTPTGGRLRRLRPLIGTARFLATYADGLSDLDLSALLRFHESHRTVATMTVVRPQLPFGVAQLDGDGNRILGFTEKPRSEHWINGGFLCLEAAIFDHLGEDSILEREPLQRLAATGQLSAYRHQGFWHCMDTYKDAVSLNDLWRQGRAPWCLWESRQAGASRPSLSLPPVAASSARGTGAPARAPREAAALRHRRSESRQPPALSPQR